MIAYNLENTIQKNTVYLTTAAISWYFSSLVSKGVIPRNRHMHTMVNSETGLFGARKIFVIGGSGHFRQMWLDPYSKTIVSEMHAFLKNYSSVILIPKTRTFFYAPLKSVDWAELIKMVATIGLLTFTVKHYRSNL